MDLRYVLEERQHDALSFHICHLLETRLFVTSLRVFRWNNSLYTMLRWQNCEWS